jgi:hypothetical protein
MKRNLTIAILFSCIFISGYSQDVIITTNKDTIDCKINKITRNSIFFELTTKGLKSTGEIPLENVLTYTFPGKAISSVQNRVVNELSSRLRFGVSGGLGYILSSSKNAEEDMVSQGFTLDNAQSYYKDLKSGLYANANITWLINPYYGAGIKYNFFDTSGSTEGFMDPGDGVNLYYTTYKEHIYVNYAGVEVLFQQSVGNLKSFKLNSSYSTGLAMYRNETEYLNGYYLVTGRNIGMDFGLGLEYSVTRFLSVGTDLTLFYSSIHKMKITDGTDTSTIDLEKGNYENLTRVNISFGLRLYLWNK